MLGTSFFATRTSFVLSLVLGGLAAALAGLAVGIPSLRLRGDYLAIVTLGFNEIIKGVIQNAEPSARSAGWAASRFTRTSFGPSQSRPSPFT